ncbi:TPA: hypothetical protein UMT89_001033 [Stenotrophomonas maltophilia]|nr:hypothetical protein [Stenotrophomonas maltophilia]
MNYLDGQKVLLGDIVDLGNGTSGVVVAVIDQGDYASGFSEEEWNYLGQGALLETSEFGLLHYSNAGHDFTLIRRPH